MSSGVRFLTAVALSATTLVVLAVNARSARATEVDLLLALATDVSNSVDGTNFRLQREGYSAAITSPRIIEAIRSGRLGRIAICYIEWSGVGEQKVLIDWTVIQDAASASRFVSELAKKPRAYSGDVPHFVEHCEAVAAEIDVKRRWLGEQGRRVSFCSGVLPERHVTREVACEPSVVGSLWPLPA